MEQTPFRFMNIPHRPGKPRETGITMVVDHGMGIAQQRDILNIAGAYIDIAKFAVGLSGITSEGVLTEKIAVYSEHEVNAFVGGQFLEYGVYHPGLKIAKRYFEEPLRLGFEYVEVSDNCLEIKPEDKYELIRMGAEDFGIKILGEVGSKIESSSTQAMIDGINGCLASGSWKVFVEAAELTDKRDGSIRKDLIQEISQSVDQKDIIFELPGPWISNVHFCDIHKMKVFLIEQFGGEVNIANMAPDKVMMLETHRTGVGVKLG